MYLMEKALEQLSWEEISTHYRGRSSKSCRKSGEGAAMKVWVDFQAEHLFPNSDTDNSDVL